MISLRCTTSNGTCSYLETLLIMVKLQSWLWASPYSIETRDIPTIRIRIPPSAPAQGYSFHFLKCPRCYKFKALPTLRYSIEISLLETAEVGIFDDTRWLYTRKEIKTYISAPPLHSNVPHSLKDQLLASGLDHVSQNVQYVHYVSWQWLGPLLILAQIL
jgi:hypothetical protein